MICSACTNFATYRIIACAIRVCEKGLSRLALRRRALIHIQVEWRKAGRTFIARSRPRTSDPNNEQAGCIDAERKMSSNVLVTKLIAV